MMSTTASTHSFRFSPEKTIDTRFFRPNPDTNLKIYHRDIKWSDRAKYLGVSIDKQLNMHSQVIQTLNSVSRSLNAIKVMSSLSLMSIVTLYSKRSMIVRERACIMGQRVLTCSP